MKLRINERMLKEGPGAGYTIHFGGLSNVSINNAQIIDRYDNEKEFVKGYVLAVEGTCTIDKLSADSYYYGTEDIYDVPANIEKVWIDWYHMPDDFDPETASDAELAECAESELTDWFENGSYTYGGGWMHSTYDGTIGEIKDSNSDVVELRITDREVIDYIDKAVQGETIYDVYYVEDEDDDIIEAFDDEEQAVAFAKEVLQSGEYSEVTVERVEEKYLLGGEPDVDFYGESEVVWQEQYEQDEDFDDDEF